MTKYKTPTQPDLDNLGQILKETYADADPLAIVMEEMKKAKAEQQKRLEDFLATLLPETRALWKDLDLNNLPYVYTLMGGTGDVDMNINKLTIIDSHIRAIKFSTKINNIIE